MRIHPLLPALAIAVLLASRARGADVPAAVDANDAGAMKGLINDLGNPNYPTRERAQRLLETVPYAQIETLRKIAEGVTDSEAKLRMGIAIDRIEEIGITTVPPISVDLKDAKREEVAAALSKVMQTRLSTLSTDDERFTLKAENLSFWEVLHRLDAQHPLALIGPSTIARASFAAQTTRGFAFYAILFPGSKSTFDLRIDALADPRLKVFAMKPPQIDSACDHAGQDFTPMPGAPQLPESLGRTGDPPSGKTASLRFQTAEPTATTATFKGSVTCLIQASEARLEVADARKHLGEAMALGDNKVTIRKISPADQTSNRPVVYLEIVPDKATLGAPAAPPITFSGIGASYPENLAVPDGTLLTIDAEGSPGSITRGKMPTSGEPTQVTLLDATGRIVTKYTIPRGVPVTNVHAIPDDFKQPLTFIFTYPKRTREVTIPFEFKDLPIK